MNDDLTKRAHVYLAITASTIGFEDESASIIAAYMQRDAEQRAEIERLRHTLKSLADEFVRVFPIYYYAEPWAHDQNMVLKSARSVLGHEKKEPTHD